MNTENIQTKPKKRHIALWVFLIMIILGLVLSFIGGIWFYNTKEKYYIETESFDKKFDAADISKLKFDFGIGNIYIKPSEDSTIYVKAENVPKNYYTFNTENGTFSMNLKKDLKNNNFLNWINIDDNFENSKMTILVPQKIYDKLSIDAGVGESYISGISCKDADFQQGVGKSNYENLTVSGRTVIDCGVGETNLSSSTIGNADIDCGVGEFTFSGKLIGNLDLDVGVGSAEINIDGLYGDYNIDDDDKDFVKVNDEGKSYSQSVSGKYNIDVDSGIGEVSINFI